MNNKSNKILFASRYYKGSMEDNLSKKFRGEIEGLEECGYEVSYLSIEENNIYINDKAGKKYVCKYPQVSIIKSIRSLFQYSALYKATSSMINNNKDSFALYCRSLFPIHSGFQVLKCAKKNEVKTIMEIPTYPPQKEYRTIKMSIRKIMLLMADHWSRRMAKYVDLYALCGEKANSYNNKPAVNFENGVFSRGIRKKTIRDKKNRLDLIGAAMVAYYHGYDRLVKGIKSYYDNDFDTEVFFHIAGKDADGSLEMIKRYTKDNHLERYIIFHDFLKGDELEDFFCQGDIGVGSLGSHRRNISVSAELKVRDYLVRGLPIIVGRSTCLDTVLDKYAMRVSSDDSPIEIKDVIKYYNGLNYSDNDIQTISSYAREAFSWKKQMKTVLEALGQT